MNWENIFLIWISILPFVVWNGAYEGPKIIYFLAGSVVWCLFGLIFLHKKLTESLKKYDIFFGLFVLALFISSLLGVHPAESIIGGSYRHQGAVFFIGLFLVGKTIAILSKKSKSRFIKIISFWIIAETLWILINPLGSFGEKNAAAGFLAIISSFAPSILFIFSLGAIAITTSRSAFLALLASGIPRIKKNHWKIFLVLIPIGLFIFVRAMTLRPPSKVEDRVLFARIAIGEIIKKPLIGYGAESGEVVYDNYFIRIAQPLDGLMIDRSHNLILDLLMWSGGVGFVFFSIWFTMRTKVIFEAKDWQKLSGIFSFLIFSFLQPLGVIHWLLIMMLFEL